MSCKDPRAHGIFNPGYIVDFGVFCVQTARKIIMSGVEPSVSNIPINHKCDQICRAEMMSEHIPPGSCDPKEDVCAAMKAKDSFWKRIFAKHKKCHTQQKICKPCTACKRRCLRPPPPPCPTDK